MAYQRMDTRARMRPAVLPQLILLPLATRMPCDLRVVDHAPVHYERHAVVPGYETRSHVARTAEWLRLAPGHGERPYGLAGACWRGRFGRGASRVCAFHMPVVLRHDLIHGARAVLVDAWVRVYEEQRGLWHLLKHVACQQLRAYAVEQSKAIIWPLVTRQPQREERAPSTPSRCLCADGAPLGTRLWLKL